MGFLGKLFGKKDEEAAVELSSAVTQQPVYEEKLQTIDMSKHNENLGKVLIDMSKGSKIDMTKHTARVALAMDYSGSMDDNGSVQETISRLLPIALRFDDNGELESWLFSNGAERLKAANADNYSSYVKNVMKKAHMYMGGTNYAPVLKWLHIIKILSQVRFQHLSSLLQMVRTVILLPPMQLLKSFQSTTSSCSS